MKNVISSLLCVFLTALVLSCTKPQDNKSREYTTRVTDYFGRPLFIPTKVNRVIPLFYVQAEMICVLGASDKIVGIGQLFAVQSPIIHNYFPQLYRVPQVGNLSNVDYEKVISLKPDIVFCGPEKATLDGLERLNILSLPTFPRNSLQISEQILLYGKIFDKTQNAEDIVRFLNAEYEKVTNITEAIEIRQRPKVYYARTDFLTTLGGGINSEIIRLVGGISVTNDLSNDKNGIKVSLEDIYRWNPDAIIIRDRALTTAEDIYKDERLAKISAVRNRRVYRETYGWTEFRIGMFFGMLEKAKWLHPDLFKGINPQSEYDQFVKLFRSFER
jgi:iron complex transport system substrate-binding protein